MVAAGGHEWALRPFRCEAGRLISSRAHYDDPSAANGKATAESDVVDARFVDIVPPDRVVHAVDFVSDDPGFAGTMTMTWKVTAAESGTRVDITAEEVPNGISAEDHAAGLTSSLANLAAFGES